MPKLLDEELEMMNHRLMSGHEQLCNFLEDAREERTEEEALADIYLSK